IPFRLESRQFLPGVDLKDSQRDQVAVLEDEELAVGGERDRDYRLLLTFQAVKQLAGFDFPDAHLVAAGNQELAVAGEGDRQDAAEAAAAGLELANFFAGGRVPEVNEAFAFIRAREELAVGRAGQMRDAFQLILAQFLAGGGIPEPDTA